MFISPYFTILTSKNRYGKRYEMPDLSGLERGGASQNIQLMNRIDALCEVAFFNRLRELLRIKASPTGIEPA